jgi:hypothetical protein
MIMAAQRNPAMNAAMCGKGEIAAAKFKNHEAFLEAMAQKKK